MAASKKKQQKTSDKVATIFVLIEPKMLPVPATLEVEGQCTESVVDEGLRVHEGITATVRGRVADIQAWLRPFDGVWVSECPAAGVWHVAYVKE